MLAVAGDERTCGDCLEAHLAHLTTCRAHPESYYYGDNYFHSGKATLSLAIRKKGKRIILNPFFIFSYLMTFILSLLRLRRLPIA